MSNDSYQNAFFNIVNKRFSYRGYHDREIDEEDLRYILRCSVLAPSAANKQPWKIHIVRDQKIRKDLHGAYSRSWFFGAPVIVVFTGLHGENWVRRDGLDYLMCDVTIIADYFMLAATEKGLGTCYIAAFEQDVVRDALNLPENEIPFLMTPLGYPDESAKKERVRKGLSEIAVFY